MRGRQKNARRDIYEATARVNRGEFGNIEQRISGGNQ